MEQYLNLIEDILSNANYKENRTGVDTLSTFSQHYEIDLQKGFPLLTTKNLSGYRWNSLIHEILWYFSGEEHIRNLREHTKIWNAWADDEGKLDTAYGRFWRRYPVPDQDSQLAGEAWADEDCKWVTEEDDGRLVFDQIQYVIDTLNGENPDKGPNSRRLVINAWHPSNAAVSDLPPCHFNFVINVQNGKINTHLTQRSADTALGVPFNIACYSIITKIIAAQTNFEVGKFSHTLVDAHIYCGKGERGEWYGENIEELREKVREAENPEDYLEVKKWIEENAPEGNYDGEKPYDHIPGLLEQVSREPRERPVLEIEDKDIEDLEYEDFELKDYNPYPGLKFAVAE